MLSRLLTTSPAPLRRRGAKARPTRVPLALYLEQHPQPRYVGIMGVAFIDGAPLVYEMQRPDLRPMIYLSSVAESLFWALDVLAGSFVFTNAPRHVGMYFITARRQEEWWLVRHQHESPFLTPEQVEIARDFKQYADFVLGYARPG